MSVDWLSIIIIIKNEKIRMTLCENATLHSQYDKNFCIYSN